MSNDLDLVAELREDQGKGASRRLRREGKVPAILYGGGREPRALALDHNKLLHQMEKESFYSSILSIKAGERTQPAIVKDVQRHASKSRILHIDLQRILADEKIRMSVPVHLLNEDDAVGVKSGGGVISRLINEIEIVCLPADLPEYFELDIANLDVDEMLHLSDIKVPDGVEIPALAQEQDQGVVAIHIPKAITEPEDEEGEVDAEAAAGEAGEADADVNEGEDS